MSENTAAGMESAPEPSSSSTYRLDAAASTFSVQAFAGGLLGGFAHNPTMAIRDFVGEAHFVPGTFAGASVRLVVRARSLELVDEVSAKDRAEIERVMRDDVLEVGAYPEIVFASTSVTVTRAGVDRAKARIVGDLTLHGVTRKGLWISALVRADVEGVRATGEFTLKQTDYSIRLVSVAGGVIKVKDELKFTFDLLGRPAPSA